MWLRYGPRLTVRQRFRLYLSFISAVLTVLLVLGTIHLQDLLSSMAVTRVSNTAGRIVTAAVSDAIDSGEIQYDKLISLQKDNAGGITALQSNMAEFNRLQAAITEDVLNRLSQVSETNLSIPLGTLTGSPLLAGRGPRFTVKMETIGSCTARFENTFAHAGINQTTHSIMLHVDVSMSILLPGQRTSTKVSNAYSVAETVIVGDVPDSYTYFDSGNDVEEDAFEYSINNG